MCDSYTSLASAIEAAGFTAQQGQTDQLIVSTQRGPVWPNRGNSFWLSCQNCEWYLSTWSPICYRIPPQQDIVALCSACMKASTSAMYVVPEEIVERFSLERISAVEFDRLFSKW